MNEVVERRTAGAAIASAVLMNEAAAAREVWLQLSEDDRWAVLWQLAYWSGKFLQSQKH